MSDLEWLADRLDERANQMRLDHAWIKMVDPVRRIHAPDWSPKKTPPSEYVKLCKMQVPERVTPASRRIPKSEGALYLSRCPAEPPKPKWKPVKRCQSAPQIAAKAKQDWPDVPIGTVKV